MSTEDIKTAITRELMREAHEALPGIIQAVNEELVGNVVNDAQANKIQQAIVAIMIGIAEREVEKKLDEHLRSQVGVITLSAINFFELERDGNMLTIKLVDNTTESEK